ncbi:MAG TPA: hypothetical protein PLS29_05295 [Acidimicrobiales bacterium]|nr:hypothetical protein [Acidimicrobiales bacterium]
MADVVRPFLREVLLEDDLDTSWAFTRLLAKSFARGRPSTHPEGVGALTRALAARTGASVRLGTRVTAVSPRSVTTEDGTVAASAVVAATDAHDAADLLGTGDVAWHRQFTWWWSTPRVDTPGRLRLDGDDPLTTSALDVAAVAPERAPRGRSLVATPSIEVADTERARVRVARLYDLATHDVELVTVTDVARAAAGEPALSTGTATHGRRRRPRGRPPHLVVHPGRPGLGRRAAVTVLARR